MSYRAVTRFSFFVVFGSLLVLQGCGFHLRGKFTMPEEVMNVYISGGEIEFVSALEKVLTFSEVNIAESPQNVSVLDLSEMSYERDVHSTDDFGRAKQYILRYSIPYTLTGDDGSTLQDERVSSSKTLDANPEQVIQSEREEEFKREEMQKELANRLARQLSRLHKE